MAQGALKIEDRFTWADYCSWPDTERCEIIGGKAFAMSPAPTTRHQSVLIDLTAQFYSHFRGKTCQVFAAPTDIRLSEEDVVQPDLFVVCDKNLIKPTHIDGAPTLVIEVLSPSTEVKDRSCKLRLYAASGVREVWLVTPWPSLVEVLTLDGDSYRIAGVYEKEGSPMSVVFSDLQIDLSTVFDFPLAPEERIKVVKEGRSPYHAKRE